MTGRVGGKESFEQGREDLQELAGVVVKTKHVGRISEELGTQIEALGKQERESAMSGKVVPLLPAVPKLYNASMAPECRWSLARPRGAEVKRKTGRRKPARPRSAACSPRRAWTKRAIPLGMRDHDLCRRHRASRGLRQAHLYRGDSTRS